VKNPPVAPASVRNAPPILEVLRYELQGRRNLLEIGSGTGQHAVMFAKALPHLLWQPSDLVETHAGIRAYIEASNIANLKAPLELDVRSADSAASVYDSVYTCNTMHIMSFTAVRKMLALVSATLPTNGVFCAYGPFRIAGEFSSESNAAFDAMLQTRNRKQGIRDIEAIDEIAAQGGMRRVRTYAMPANNLLPVWVKSKERGS
jgi:cyclopropane fatty-acyl-phospholipid synthase-like methyltransferase